MSCFENLRTPETDYLFSLFYENGVDARLVGGCVRDALLGIKTKDIDIAVDIPPQKTQEILSESGIKVIPTGIEHGTVTAVVNKTPFQITSLRQDWQTDGRHAKVIFGKDWLQDAKRRDFTINALSLDKNGILYDPFGGQSDLEKGIIRFIGNAAERIQEDYLRILRYYRFLAFYGKGEPKPIPALKQYREGLNLLSKERISQEFLKLLTAKNPLMALALMKKDEIFLSLFNKNPSLEMIHDVIEQENTFNIQVSSIRRLYALFQENSNLVLSNKQKNHLESLNKALAEQDQRYVYYFYGKEVSVDWALWSTNCRENLKWLEQQGEYTFPLKGQDLLEKGIEAGPFLGLVLRETEKWWISQDFKPGKNECLKKALKKIDY